MYARLRDWSKKGWSYSLQAAVNPRELPFLAKEVLHGTHPGELMKLNRHRRWLINAGIQTVIDVGAHAGEFASAIHAILPQARIFAFEPLQAPYERMMERFRTKEQVTGFNVALGNEQGEMAYWRHDFTKSSSLLRMTDLHKEAYPWSSASRLETVKMDRLDAISPALDLRPPILLKLDVQGYENRVLEGAAMTLGAVDMVVVEVSFRTLYEGQSSFNDTYDLLSRSGFSYAGSMDTMLSPLDQSIMQEDAVFVRSPE